MLQRLQAVLNRFEITVAEANELVALQDYKIVIVADDSGSMQAPAEPSASRTIGQPFRSRWDELKETITSIVEIASCFDDTGIDIHFLNRAPALKIKSSADPALASAFKDDPYGRTPLTEALQSLAGSLNCERGQLLFIFTDGEPNGGKYPFIRQLTSIVKSSKIRVQIMVCTAEDDEVEWLNGLDRELKEVDVTDDYFSERREVVRAGLASQFTRGDWCMKAMLGPISHKFDKWDESLKKNKVGTCELCSVQ